MEFEEKRDEIIFRTFFTPKCLQDPLQRTFQQELFHKLCKKVFFTFVSLCIVNVSILCTCNNGMTNSLLILQAQPNNSFRSLEIRITQVLA